MKLTKYLLGLLFAPALMMMGCSDYEDTEIISPQADENASGTNFPAASVAIVVHPDGTAFDLTLRRINSKAAASIPVIVTSCDEVSTGVKFCEQPTAFSFAAGETTAKITLNAKPECEFQKTYKMALKIGDEKDHIYSAGTSSATVSYIKDYKWIALGQPVILEEGWHNGGILVPVEWASNFKDGSGKMLFRLKALYAYAGKAASTSMGHIQFYLDTNYAPAGTFSINGYNPEKINTGALQAEGVHYFMKVTDITGGAYDEKGKLETPYVFTHDIFYGNTPTVEKAGITATLDFNIKAIMEEE